MKDAENMDILTTEEGRKEAADVINNGSILYTRSRKFITVACSSKKRLAKDLLLDEFRYTSLLSRKNLKEAIGADRKTIRLGSWNII